MIRIQKEILLDRFVSRLPSIVPSYMDNEIYYFDADSLKDREFEYPSNYGMVPINIVLKQCPNSALTHSSYEYSTECNCYGKCDCGKDSCDCKILDKNDDGTYNVDDEGTIVEKDGNCNFTLSFRTVSDWFYFFKEYYNLLEDYGHCDRVYSSATDYYESESRNPKYSSQMVYGADRGTYEALDELFSCRGGKVSATTSETLCVTEITSVEDIGFYRWLSDNVVPSFSVPREYQDYWNVKRLYYPDVVKWMGWLKERIDLSYEANAKFEKGKDGEVDTWNCKEEKIKDCCDCEEYFNRGGERMYNAMKTWFDEIQTKIKALNKAYEDASGCFEPYFINDIYLRNTIDDLGEFSILSKEYENGIDYRTVRTIVDNGRTNIWFLTENIHSGTTAVDIREDHEGESIILSNGMGFCYDNVLMETLFCEDNWESYTDLYKNSHKEEFEVTDFKYYSFDENNRKIIGESEDEVKEQFFDYYPITTTDSVVINGSLYNVMKAESGKTNGGKTYFVYRDEYTNTPYAVINGKKIYAEFFPYVGGESCSREPYYYFTIFKEDGYKRKAADCEGDRVDIIEKSFKDDKAFYKHYGRVPNDDDMVTYIEYCGSPYIVKKNATNCDVNEDTYNRISGYTFDKDGEIYFAMYGSSDVKYTADFLVTDAKIEDEFIKVPYSATYETNPIVYSANTIIGTTSSKLNDLASTNLLMDDIGHSINGLFDITDKYNHQPKEGSELEPLYQVSNTAHILPYTNTETDPNKIEGDINYFVGDIIEEMSFYYKEADGNINYATMFTCKLRDNGNCDILSGESRTNKETNLSGYTSLSAITFSTKEKTELEKDEDGKRKVFEENIYCDITYYVGATLSRKNKEKFTLSKTSGKNNHGVKYVETVRFVRFNEEYYLKKQRNNRWTIPSERETSDARSVSYPLVVFELTQDKSVVVSDAYDTKRMEPLARFESEIDINGYYDEVYGDDISTKTEVYPIFREEYRLGISSMQNVDSDIYIDRGINAAFEKHIKLGEVTSLEALENYGNSWFKMIEN